MGSWMGTGRAPRRVLISSTTASKSAPARSILLMKASRGHVKAVGLPPDRLGLGLDPRDPAEHHHRPVEHAQRALDLDGEVDVAGGVDQVQLVVAPLDGGGGRRDGDAALALLRHPVHLGLAVVHLADLVDASGVEQEPLADGGLAGVDVRDHPDVAGAGELGLLCDSGFGRGGHEDGEL